jgi:hypothetical protein
LALDRAARRRERIFAPSAAKFGRKPLISLDFMGEFFGRNWNFLELFGSLAGIFWNFLELSEEMKGPLAARG